MKKTTQLMASMILLSTLLFGDLNNYSSKLFNDLQLVNQQKDYINEMGRILKSELNDKDSLKTSKKLFNKLLTKLVVENKELILNANEIRKIRQKSSRLKRLWKEEHECLEVAFSDNRSRLKAINTIDKMNFYMRGIVSVYSKSYSRYQKQSGRKNLIAMN